MDLFRRRKKTTAINVEQAFQDNRRTHSWELWNTPIQPDEDDLADERLLRSWSDDNITNMNDPPPPPPPLSRAPTAIATSLQYVPFASEVELPFYSVLSSLKIDHDRLNETVRSVLGLYEPGYLSTTSDSCRMQILGNALTTEGVPAGFVRAEGKIKNYNTLQDFKTSDKAVILQSAAKQIWDAIRDGTIYSVPSLLSSFAIISFADLKKHKFHYWFGFPALHSSPVWEKTNNAAKFESIDTSTLVERVGTWKYGADPREHGFFLAKRIRKTAASRKMEADHKAQLAAENGDDEEDAAYETDEDRMDYKWDVASLREFEKGFFNDTAEEDCLVAFVDPSTYRDAPGWCLRNLLVLISERFKLNKVNILCYRDIHARRHEAKSFIISLRTKTQQNLDVQSTTPLAPSMPKVTGWERDGTAENKIRPRMTNLAQYMNPEQLAHQSVDLNLKLMKWRLAPSLDLDKIKHTKCLLLGAGTLGSYVARNLLGWGVRNITFVDYGSVSYSNPVRQPLFNFQDCQHGGRKKAERAAEALAEIYPGVNATGHAMAVPMLGHPILDEASTRADYEKLHQLFAEHDVIFLLMDTRESRWLPTLMGKAMGKTVLNAALGFDTYVVMRHGITPLEGGQATLGCYFCNDVVAPEDSMKDSTLDQQCTVTRPGVAAIASAYLVELLVSLLQHPAGAGAGAPKSAPSQASTSVPEYIRDPVDHPLGLVPHQIRGFLGNFNNLLISGQSYDCCSACSDKVVNAYNESGWEFVKKALTEKDYITELSGLAEVQRRAEEAAEAMDAWTSEDDQDIDHDEGEMI